MRNIESNVYVDYGRHVYREKLERVVGEEKYMQHGE